jgi:hypothetical protein
MLVSAREDIEMTFEDGLQQVEKANKLIVKANQMITDAHMKAFFSHGIGGYH